MVKAHSCCHSLTLDYIFIFSTISICLKFTGVKKRKSGEINYILTQVLIRSDSTASPLWRRGTVMECVIKLFFWQMNKELLPNKHCGGQIRNSICVSIRCLVRGVWPKHNLFSLLFWKNGMKGDVTTNGSGLPLYINVQHFYFCFRILVALLVCPWVSIVWGLSVLKDQ